MKREFMILKEKGGRVMGSRRKRKRLKERDIWKGGKRGLNWL